MTIQQQTTQLWLLLLTSPASVLPVQVIPIYGRGSDFDPRQEAIKVQPVPPRPAGQRPSAVQVSHHGSAAQQAGGKHTSHGPDTCHAERAVSASLHISDTAPAYAVQPTALSAAVAKGRQSASSVHSSIGWALATCTLVHDTYSHVAECRC